MSKPKQVEFHNNGLNAVRRYRARLICTAVILSTAICAVSYFFQVAQYAQPLFQLDDWHMVDIYLKGTSWFSGFLEQHGPHRMGLVYILYALAYQIGDFSLTDLAYTQAVFYVATCLLALYVSYRIKGRFTLFDALLPLLFLNHGSVADTVRTPFIHGLFPFFLVLTLALFQLENRPLRIGSISVVCVVAFFTFHSNIAGLAVLLVSVLAWMVSRKREWLVYIALSVLTLLYLFLTQNLQKLSVPPGSFDIYQVWIYLVALVSNFLFVSEHSFHYPGAMIILVILFLSVGYPVYEIIRNPKKTKWVNINLFLPLIATILYLILHSLSRNNYLGIANLYESRYVAATGLMLFALYASLLHLKSRNLRIAGLICFTLFSMSFYYTGHRKLAPLADRQNEIRQFNNCLIQGGTYYDCEGLLQRPIHPNPEQAGVVENIEKFREEQLSIFSSK